ncbi:MAG: hypothetical protein JO051_03440 [Acidobacteriaceae bacterium]|nr:hypothetical protein [Acidobacteriaceae bacterium]
MVIWDKLGVLNEALRNTGNHPVNTVADGSDEWEVASAAFDQWVPILLSERNWHFATQTQTLDRLGDSSYPGFVDEFALPADLMQLINVWSVEAAGLVYPYQGWGRPDEDMMPPPLQWSIVGNRLQTTARDGAIAKYIAFPTTLQPWSVGFVKALRYRIEAAIYRGLNEDMSEAARCDKEADRALIEAGSRSTSEEPRRAGFRSGLAEARRYGRSRVYR